MTSQCGADSIKFLQWHSSVRLFQLSFSSGVPVYPASIRLVAQLYPSVHWVNQWHSGVHWTSQCILASGKGTCRQLSKRLPENSTIFAAEATAISLALNSYQHMGPVHHDVVVYSDSMSCLQAIEGEDTEKSFICHIMNLLWLLSGKGTHVRFCCIPSHYGIEGNEIVDQLAYETLDQDIDPLVSETTGQLLHSDIGSNQVGCSCTSQRSLSPETKIRATEEIPALNQSWSGCNHPNSNWPYKGHRIPYLVPRTPKYLSPLWSNTDRWPYAPGVCSVTGMSW